MEDLWRAGRRLIEEFERIGYEAYFVGGAVRNSLMHLPVEEIDIATGAPPEVSLRHFPKVFPTGLAFGTVTILWEGYPFEVTTFRKEFYGSRGRNPIEVIYSNTLQEDLERRDFTMNAIAMDKSGRIIDPFGGKKDISDHLVRAVGDARLRFREDGLRLLRAIRFALYDSFRIEKETWSALLLEKERIKEVSLERIVREMEKILRSAHAAKGISLISEAGLLFTVADPSILTAIEKTEDELLRFALLFSGIEPVPGVPFSYSALPLRRKVRDGISFLLTEWEKKPVRSKEEILRMAYHEDRERVLRLAQFLALKRGEEPVTAELRRFLDGLPFPDRLSLPINGQDLIRHLSRPGGPWVSKTLEWIWEGLNFRGFPRAPELLLNKAKEFVENQDEGVFDEREDLGTVKAGGLPLRGEARRDVSLFEDGDLEED